MHQIKKRLLYPILLLPAVSWLISCSASQPIVEDYRTETYKKRTAYFSQNPLREEQIVFFGNSITQAGNWESYFPEQRPANRGISGDNTEGMLARIDEVVKAKPAKFFIMAGINDISLSRSNTTIVRNYREIIRAVKKGSPQTRIYIQSLLPINNDFAQYKRLAGKERQVSDLNIRLRALAQSESTRFVHLFPYFTDSAGKLKKKFTDDGLHLTPEAYSLWVEIIRRDME